MDFRKNKKEDPKKEEPKKEETKNDEINQEPISVRQLYLFYNININLQYSNFGLQGW